MTVSTRSPRLFGDRAELFAFVALIAALNGFADRVMVSARANGVLDSMLGLGGISVIGWFAFYAILAIALERDGAQRIERGDVPIALLMLLLCAVPLVTAGAVALGLGGVYLVLRSPGGSRTRRIGAICLALTGPLLVGPLCIRLFGSIVLMLDAQLTGLVAATHVTGNVVDFVGAPGGFYVATGCSSLHNMSLAIVLWATLVQLFRLRITPGIMLVGVAAAVAMIVINIIRLAALARFPAHFDMLHTGAGSTVFGMVELLVAGLVVGVGLVATTRRPA